MWGGVGGAWGNIREEKGGAGHAGHIRTSNLPVASRCALATQRTRPKPSTACLSCWRLRLLSDPACLPCCRRLPLLHSVRETLPAPHPHHPLAFRGQWPVPPAPARAFAVSEAAPPCFRVNAIDPPAPAAAFRFDAARLHADISPAAAAAAKSASFSLHELALRLAGCKATAQPQQQIQGERPLPHQRSR